MNVFASNIYDRHFQSLFQSSESCIVLFRSNRPEVFLGKGVLKICSKFTGEYLSRSVISRKLQSNFIEIIYFGMDVAL